MVTYTTLTDRRGSGAISQGCSVSWCMDVDALVTWLLNRVSSLTGVKMVPEIHSHGERRKPEEKHLSASPCQTAANTVAVRENRADQRGKSRVLGLGVCVCKCGVCVCVCACGLCVCVCVCACSMCLCVMFLCICGMSVYLYVCIKG